MRIAAAQMSIKYRDKELNMKRAEEMFEKAAGKADLIIFPEMSLTGFSMHTDSDGESFEISPSLEFFKKCAKKYSMAVCFGFIRTEGGKAYNSSVIMDKNGNFSQIYDKIHPFSGGREGEYYAGGNKVIWEKIGDMTVSPFICYDLRFPEIFQAASEKSGLLIVIANWPQVRIHAAGPLLRARAIENQSYALFVNTTGFSGKIQYSGESCCFDPWGDPVFKAEDAEDVYIFEIDETLPQTVRESFKMRPDRKNPLYVKLYEENLINPNENKQTCRKDGRP